MTIFAKFDKKNLESLRREMQEVLNKYGLDANLDFKVGQMKFGDNHVEIKVESVIKGGKSKVMEHLEQALMFPVWDNVTGKMKGKMKDLIDLKNDRGDELIGYDSKKRTKPYIFKSGADGKSYVADEKYVLHYFKKKAA